MSCTQKVRETFQKLDGVAAVDVNFDAKTATITMQKDKTLTREVAEEALKKSGYGLTSFEAKPPGNPAGA